MDHKGRFSLLLILILLLAACGERENPSAPEASTPVIESSGAAPVPEKIEPEIKRLQQGKSYVFLERDTDATDGGVQRLIDKMEAEGLAFYKTAAAPHGLIARDDVVLLKINCQWAQRGGTNTDLIRAVAQSIATHPDGFAGEIVIADSGQGQYGTSGTGGSLDWPESNSANRDQSVMDVVRELSGAMNISGYLWDDISMNQVAEYADGDLTDGFVVEDGLLGPGLEVSYPKFTTSFGTQISFKHGIWNGGAGAYNAESLKVINMPVLKSHSIYHVTGAVKSYMGVVANRLTGHRPHSSVGRGGMGALMAATRMPVLNILDMIWVGAGKGPGSTYDSAAAVRMIAAGTDPVALDYWAAKQVLMPQLSAGADAADPDGTAQGGFGDWLRLSAAELEKAGHEPKTDPESILMIE